MARNVRVYPDMMVLSAFCGAPIRADNEAAVSALEIGFKSGLLLLCRGWEHDTELARYKNRARRACMKRFLRLAAVHISRSWVAEQCRIGYLAAGVHRGDAAHLAAAATARADFVTLDKQLLGMRDRLEGVTICTPQEFIGGDDDSTTQAKAIEKSRRMGRRKQDRGRGKRGA